MFANQSLVYCLGQNFLGSYHKEDGFVVDPEQTKDAPSSFSFRASPRRQTTRDRSEDVAAANRNRIAALRMTMAKLRQTLSRL